MDIKIILVVLILLNIVAFSYANVGNMKTAEQYLGWHEKTHAALLNKKIEKYTKIKINVTKTPWCAAFVALVLAEQNKPYSRSLMARSYLKIGKPVTEPKIGDLVVLSRTNNPKNGHVGFFAGIASKNGQKYIRVLGGNQSNKVGYKLYKHSRLLGYRRI